MFITFDTESHSLGGGNPDIIYIINKVIIDWISPNGDL